MSRKKNSLFILIFAIAAFILDADTIWAATPGESSDSPVRKVVVASSRDMVPFHFIDEAVQPTGIVVDLWKLRPRSNGDSRTYLILKRPK